MYQTNQYEGMLAETITMHGANGDTINAYFARPLGPGPYPGVVLIHHLPGWDEWYREATRKFAHHGYAAISPNLYCREGHGTPEDVAAKVRGAGGVPDDQVVGDVAGRMALSALAALRQRQSGRLRHLLGRAPRLPGRLSCAGLRRRRGLLGRPRGDRGGRADAQAARCAAGLHRGPVMPAPGPLRRGGPEPHAGAGGPPRAGAQEAWQDL